MKRHGSGIDPPNRFERIHTEADVAELPWDTEHLDPGGNRRIEYLEDESRTIVSENQSPDVPFRYTLNPYRGCAHGCSYCYARPTHEFLGLNAGLDFETRIVVKRRAAELFREFLAKPKWEGEAITFSGVTDCYQPAEREFQLTRRCLEVALACRQPVGVVTKNALVARDLDVLRRLAAENLVHVFLSINSLDGQLARDMEPRTSIPDARLRAVRMLAEAEVPTGVILAPIVPGLNDSSIPAVLEAAKQHGAMFASYVLLRLPLTVEPVFREWLERTQPLRAERVLSRIRQTREGRLNTSEWGTRMVGRGEIADQIRELFLTFRKIHQLDSPLPPLDSSGFEPPPPPSGQLRLF